MTALASVRSPAPLHAWRQAMAADPFALVTQSPEWLEAMTTSAHWYDASRHYVFADGREAVLPMVRRGVAGTRSPHASYGEGWGMGGLLAPQGPRPGEIAAVLDDLAALPAVAAEVRPNPLLAATWAQGAAGADVVVRSKRAHVLDLGGGADIVWNERFTYNARRYARRAEQEGVEIVRDGDGSLLPVFYDLLLRSIERWARQSNEPLWLARARAKARDPLAKFTHMRRSLGAALRLYVAFNQGTPAAGILVLVDANAHYTRGVMDVDAIGRTHANELLHWVAIREACESGCAAYHMGETGSSASLAKFKEKFGARPIDYATYRTERLPIGRADAALRSAVKRVIGFREPENQSG